MTSPLPWYCTALAAVVMLLAPTMARAEPTTQPCGVWFQPPSSFPTWRARGVTALMGCTTPAENANVNEWCQKAVDAGLDYILQDDPSTEPHWNDPHCLAILATPDEPNNAGAKTSTVMYARSTIIKTKTAKPILLNLDAWAMQYQSDAVVWAYLAACDQVSADWHIVNHGDGIESLPKYVAQVERLKKLASGRKVWTFVETSDQKLGLQPWAQQPGPDGKPWATRMHGPKVSDFLAEMKVARDEGCPTCLFPDVIGLNWEAFDGTPPEIVGAMQALTAKP